MSADRETPEQDNLTDPGNDQNLLASSLLDLMMRDAIADLDDIEEPRAADLAALDELEEPSADELAALEDIEEPTAAELAALDDLRGRGGIACRRAGAATCARLAYRD